MFNFNYTEDGAVNIPTCLFDLTDYLGNTIRFYIAASSANGATEAGAVVPNDFDGWYQDVGNLDPYPQNLTMVDLTSGNDPEGYAQIIAKAINGAAGFGQYGGTMIAVTYGFDDNTRAPAAANFTNTLYSIDDDDWSVIGAQNARSAADQPAGNGFTNTSVDPGIALRLKVLVMQNNPGKVNNTQTTINLQARYEDGNTPIYTKSLTVAADNTAVGFITGEEPVSLVGGDWQEIKANLPFTAAGAHKITNHSWGSTGNPAATQSSGVTYSPPITSQVVGKDVPNSLYGNNAFGLNKQYDLHGASWSGESPNHPA